MSDDQSPTLTPIDEPAVVPGEARPGDAKPADADADAADAAEAKAAGAEFDWSAVLSNSWLECADGSKLTAADACGGGRGGPRYVALYFTASWCGPCRRFTPTLVKLYEAQPEPRAVEVVLVSCDDDDGAASEYRSHMPWLSLPDLGRDGSETVRSLCQVGSIPQLLVLDSATGEVVEQNAVANAAAVFAAALQ